MTGSVTSGGVTTASVGTGVGVGEGFVFVFAAGTIVGIGFAAGVAGLLSDNATGVVPGLGGRDG